MKKSRPAAPLTQRMIRMVLRRPATQAGFEITVTMDTGFADGDARGKEPLQGEDASDADEAHRPGTDEEA